MRQLSPYEQTQLARHGKSGPYTDADIGTQPVEYVTEVAEFCGLQFHVDKRVLIPRLETEELVDLALQAATEKLQLISDERPLVIGDIGTGAGAIAITLAKHLHNKNVRMYASDVTEDIMSVARENAKNLLGDAEPQVKFLTSDLLDSFPKDVKFDILVSNLPYIPTARIAVLDESVKDHEPFIALDGGPEGLTLIGKFLHQAATLLQPHGIVLLEVDYTHTAQDFSEFFDMYAVDVFTDSFTRNRFARLELK